MEKRTCPYCQKPTIDSTRFPGSEWHTRCVEEVLDGQAEEADAKVKPQVFRI